MVAAAIGTAAVASVAGSVISGNAASSAASTQANADLQASQSANATELQMFNQQQANLAPYIAAGTSTLPALTQGVAPGGEFNNTFTAADFKADEDPAFNFDLQTGINAAQNSAAANGTLLSGGTLAALTQYGTGMASNEFSNAYNRFMGTRQANFSNLAAVAGLGSGATSTGVQAGTAAGQVLSGNTLAGISGAGSATAGGIVGQANAFNSGLSGIGSLASQYATLNSLNNGNATVLSPMTYGASGGALFPGGASDNGGIF